MKENQLKTKEKVMENKEKVVPLRKKNRHYNSAEPVTSPKTNVDSNSFFGNMNANMIVFVQEKIHN